MSHFTVLVTGDDVPAQLQPYREFECTGVDDQYVVEVDQTADVLALMEPKEDGSPGRSLLDALEYEGIKAVADESKLDRKGVHKYGYAIVKDGVLVRAVRRTNPNAKWDWWVVGGRWTGYFTLKPGAKGRLGKPDAFGTPPKVGTADICRKRDVDVDAMRKAAEDAALPHAVVHDGRWIEIGEMGWWGVVHDEKPKEQWAAWFKEFWDALPDDTRLTLVDCHI